MAVIIVSLHTDFTSTFNLMAKSQKQTVYHRLLQKIIQFEIVENDEVEEATNAQESLCHHFGG